MIVAKKIFVHQHFYSAAKRDFIRIEFDRMSFPSTENKELEAHVQQLHSVSGNFDFLCLSENEEMKLTHDGLFLCVDGEISVNKDKESGFSYFRFLLDKQIWIEFRNDVMRNSEKNLLIYFSNYSGKIEQDEFGDLNLKVRFGFEKITWSFGT